MSAPPDLESPEVIANPYPTYARLRRELPIFSVKRPFFGRVWLLARYEDVLSTLEDHRRFASDARTAEGGKDRLAPWWMPRTINALRRSMLSSDGADHRRLRNLVHQAFTPRRVEELRATVEQRVHSLLEHAERKPQADLIADLALPLPLNIISDMLGVPEPQRPLFHDWVSRFFNEPVVRFHQLLARIPRTLRMLGYLRQLIQLRRKEPGSDLITALVQAHDQGDQLSDDELVAMIFLLLLAGYETTVNLIGSGALALLEHPEQLQRLREQPELIGPAVEELLRYTSPIQQCPPRFACEDMELHGQRIRRGDMVISLLASANRDEAAFPQPDTLDLGRTPNRHVALGMGVHYCLGAPLARLEGRVALQTLVQRFPRLRLAVPPQALRWRPSPNVRGLHSLPVHLT